MKCHLVLDPHNQGWVIEKMAKRLAEELPQFGWETNTSAEVRTDVPMNHHMMYHHVNERRAPMSTMLITHVDDTEKVRTVINNLKVVNVGICLCHETVEQLAGHGVSPQQLCYVVPACDHAVQPRRIVMGMTTHLYWDGRKREALLVKLAGEMDLSAFKFEIFGKGWEKVIEQLEKAKAEVEYFPGTVDYVGDYGIMKKRIPCFDYYLYMALDDGSLGTLDALAAGVKTIVPSQGFHRDIPGGITHPFIEYNELKRIFEQLRDERQQRIDSVRHLTWKEYARQHATVWDALLAGQAAEISKLLGQKSVGNTTDNTNNWPGTTKSRQLLWQSWQRYYLPRLRSAWPALRHKLGIRTRLKAFGNRLRGRNGIERS